MPRPRLACVAMGLRQRLGALIYDWPRYRRALRSGRWERAGRWPYRGRLRPGLRRELELVRGDARREGPADAPEPGEGRAQRPDRDRRGPCAGRRGEVQDRTAIGQATATQASGAGNTPFAIRVPYASSFQGGAQEGIIVLYSYTGNHVIAGAVMVKVLLNAS